LCKSSFLTRITKRDPGEVGFDFTIAMCSPYLLSLFLIYQAVAKSIS
jgi:hypothetical protein